MTVTAGSKQRQRADVPDPVDANLPALDAVLDGVVLSGLFGEALCADYLRYKPGQSVVARVLFADGGLGWAAGYHPRYAGKEQKMFAAAQRYNFRLRTAGLGAGHRLVLGPWQADHRVCLQHRLARRLPALAAGAEVLNYLPHRRLVLGSSGDAPRVVTKVSAKPAPDLAPLLHWLRFRQVPVLEPLAPRAGLPDHPNVTYYPWFGAADLDGLSRGQRQRWSRRTAEAAGTALAALHWSGPLPGGLLPEDDDGPRTLGADAIRSRLHALSQETASLVPELEFRLRRAARRIAERVCRPARPVLIHGDFSADQVLVDGFQLRIIDLDRCAYGPPAADLGSFAAADLGGGGLLLTPALLQGYSRSAEVDPQAVTDWTAFHLMARIQEPFRRCLPDWRGQVERRLADIEGILDGPALTGA